jgi:hypothetical protein
MATKSFNEEKVDEDTVDENTAMEQPTANQESVSLGVQDLNLMANILEAIGPRGAIRANEMEVVGNLYNKLMRFLIANGVRPVPTANPNEESTGENNA